MTEAEINIAMAEVAGWTDIWPPGGPYDFVTGMMPDGMGREAIPYFTGSLDAVVPMVRGMTLLERMKVLLALSAITNEPPFATPLQWCEAVLRAKGVWR